MFFLFFLNFYFSKQSKITWKIFYLQVTKSIKCQDAEFEYNFVKELFNHSKKISFILENISVDMRGVHILSFLTGDSVLILIREISVFLWMYCHRNIRIWIRVISEVRRISFRQRTGAGLQDFFTKNMRLSPGNRNWRGFHLYMRNRRMRRRLCALRWKMIVSMRR